MIDAAECLEDIKRIGERYAKAQEELMRRQEQHARSLTLIDREWRTRVERCINDKNEAITVAKRKRDDRKVALDVMSARIGQLRKVADAASCMVELGVLPSSDMPAVDFDDGYDWQGLEETAREVAAGFEVPKGDLLVRSADDSSQEQAVLKLSCGLNAAERYVAEQREIAHAAVRDVERLMSETLNREMQEVGAQRKRCTDEENADYVGSVAVLRASIDGCKDGSAFSGLRERIAQAYGDVLGTLASLARASFPEGFERDAYLGSFAVDISLPEELRAPFQKTLGPFCRYPTIRIPYAVDFSRNPLLVFEVSSGRRARALSGLMSLVGRKVVSAPYGEVCVAVADPLGGGTSLGPLQELADDVSFRAMRPALGDHTAIESGYSDMLRALDSEAAEHAPREFLVVLDYPCDVTKGEIDALTRLLQASTEGRASIVVLRRMGFEPPAGCKQIETLLDSCPFKVVESGDSFVLQEGGKRRPIALSMFEAFPPEYFQMLGAVRDLK